MRASRPCVFIPFYFDTVECAFGLYVCTRDRMRFPSGQILALLFIHWIVTLAVSRVTCLSRRCAVHWMFEPPSVYFVVCRALT